MVRVGLLSPVVGWTQGVPHYVAALGNALARRHDVHLFGGAIQCGMLASVCTHRVPSLPLGATLFHASYRALLPHTQRWARRRPDHDFDILHGCGWPTPNASVITAHFCQSREVQLLKALPSRRKRRTPAQGLRWLDYRMYSLMSAYMERRYYSDLPAKAVIAISQSVKQDLVDEFGISEERVHVVPDGVDVERFHPRNRLLYRDAVRRELGLEPDDMVALFVGNAWERKGLRACIQAIRFHPESRLKLLVVGDGDPSSFIEAGDGKELSRRVRFIGRRQTNVERYYAASDFLLFPTLYEPFGLVILEALASGLPVVTSASAGAAEHLTHGETGLLLGDPLDSTELKSRLDALLEEPGLAARLGSQGRLLAEEFTWDRIADRTVEVYRQVLGGRPATDHQQLLASAA
ncbi:MAG: glycosyltransferase family 4 protein [Chloroflexi bacterium]|nr:glycosyltransferase family 4 protein [Chloroflexota bacterium]